MNYFYPTSYNATTGELETSEFNSSDFNSNYGYVQKGDLLRYGNLYAINIWQQINYFSDIFSNTVNGVASSTFVFLADITENVQEAITSLRLILTNVTYSSDSNITNISNTLSSDKITVAENINCNKVVSKSSLCGDLRTSNLRVKSLIVDDVEFGIRDKGVGLFLFLGSTMYPIRNSLLVATVSSNLVLNGRFHLDVGYMFRVYNDTNICVFESRNSSNDFLYDQSINVVGHTIKLYYKGILLI
jgi:hypothetical protein